VIARGTDLLFARNLSGGGRLFDDAIAQRFSVSPRQASKVKREMASLRPGISHPTPNHERASRAILGAAGQLLSLLQSAVLFCKSQVKVTGLKVDRVMLCGGGAALDGLPQYLSGGMNVPVELFDPFRVVDTSKLDPETADALEEHKLEAVVALGLATMGSDEASYGLEILPEPVVKRREFLAGPLWLIAAAVLAVAFLAFKVVHTSGALEEIDAENRTLQRQVATAKRTHKEADELIEQNGELRAMVGLLQHSAGTGEQAARVMTFLDENLPRDFWLRQISGELAFDPELGIEHGDQRPLLLLRGQIREGTQSPVQQFEAMRDAMRRALPVMRHRGEITRDGFSIDLSLFAPPLEVRAGEEEED